MVRYCEQCGAKNKDDARFCESCGVTMPKLARAAVKAPAKTQETTPAPVVSEAPARRRGVPKIGIMAVVIAVIVIAIAALFLTGGIRVGESSPESVLTEFASASGSGNFARVRELSTGASMAAYVNAAEMGYNNIKAAYPNFSYKVEILSIETISKTDTDISFSVLDRETMTNAGELSGVNEYMLSIYLTKVDGKWKISAFSLA